MQLEDDAGAPSAPERDLARARRARAVLRRWWPVPVAAALAVVGWQLVGERRAEAVADRLRATPGVIGTTVAPPLEIVAVASDEAASVLLTGTTAPDGLVVGLVPGDATAPATVLAVDPGTGTAVWRVDVLGPAPDRALVRSGDCTDGTDGRGGALWCVVTDSRADDGTAVSTRLVEVDLAGRAVAAARDLDPGVDAVVAGDLLVVATGSPDAVRLTASDARTGAGRWTAEVPEPRAVGFAGGLSRAGGHVLVGAASATWAVDAATGALEAGGAGVAVVRGDRLVDVQGSSRTLLRGTDGTVTGEADGQVAVMAPDDGSAPDVLVSDVVDGSLQGLVRGVDATSGAVRWERPADGAARTNRLLLDGVLYGSGATSVWAVDAASGAPRWTAQGATPGEDFRLMTDGRHLLRVERVGSGGSVLAAYDLRSGDRAWETPLSEGVTSLWTRDGWLFGSAGEDLVLVR